jgi:transcriptional regulator with XRE-family HTH domain
MNLVRVHRHLQNMTQYDLGRKLGLDQSVISKIEKGLMKVSPELQNRIASVLGLEKTVLFPNAQIRGNNAKSLDSS